MQKEAGWLPNSANKNFHHIFLVDYSGSMGDGERSKYGMALAGLKKEFGNILAIAEQGEKHLVSVVYFGSDVLKQVTRANINSIGLYLPSRRRDYSTRLNDAIVNIDLMEEHTILKVLTDGQENSSAASYTQAKMVLNRVRKNGVVAFICTESDKMGIVRKYDLKSGEVQSFDNTSEGVERSVDKSIEATVHYFKSVRSGEVKNLYD